MSTADVFGAIGYAIGGPIGGAIGATIGGLIDMSLMDDSQGPRLDDVKFTTATYGNPIPKVFGPSNRVAGNIIWFSGITETENVQETGVFGLGPDQITYNYSTSLAIAISDRASTGLKRIWANNKVIFDSEANLTSSPSIASPTLSLVTGQEFTREYNPVDDETTPNFTGGTIIDYFQYISKWTNPGFMSHMDKVTFYPGSTVQDPDPLMESIEGAGNVPSYRGVSYVVIQNLSLSEFGNRIPNFEFELEAEESISIGAVIEELLASIGVNVSSTIALTNEVKGVVFARNSSLASYLPGLQTAFRFNSTQQNGDIRFLKKPESLQGTLPVEHTGGRVSDSGKNDRGPLIYQIESEAAAVDRVSLTAVDIDRDYQRNTQSAFRRTGNGGNEVAVEIPVTLNVTEIRQIAEKVLKNAWAKKWKVRFTTSSAYANLQAGYTLGIEYNDEVLPILLTRVSIGRNGLVEVEGAFEDVNTETVTVVPQSAATTSYNAIASSVTDVQLLDIPLILTGNDDAGFYWGATGGTGWPGTNLQRATASFLGPFALLNSTISRATIGDVSTALPSGPHVTFDRSNTLTVTLKSSATSLTSATEADVLAGENLAWVGPSSGTGGEIIQFVDATLVGTDTYDLSTLLRGRYGTEHEIGNHGASEVFVLLKTTSIGSESFGISDWNKERYFRGVSLYSNPDIAKVYAFTNTGIRSKPLSPVHIQGSRDASNNLTVTWVRRSRGTRVDLGDGDAPINEETESYEVDITGAGGVLIRTITATSETVTYSGTDQFNDGITPGDPVDVAIYQISATAGRGYPARGTV